MCFYSTKYSSPLGLITLASDGLSIVGLWIEGQKYFSASVPHDQVIETDNMDVFRVLKKWLDMYFCGKRPSINNISLGPNVGEFRQMVLDSLCEIPYGKLITYGEIAKSIATKRNMKNIPFRAVGSAVGHNPISIIIPCHRVIGANGNLTGYAGGIDKKIKLLQHEGIDTSNLFVPKA